MKSALAGAGVTLVLVVLAGWIAKLQGWDPLLAGTRQVGGDPPVTLSDGSLHAHSRASGWQSDQNYGSYGKLMMPNPANGSLHVGGCNGMTGLNSSGKLQPASAIFWSDDHEDWDISPASSNGTTTVHIQYSSKDDAHNNPWVVIIAPASGQLVIQSDDDYFSPDLNPGSGPHNRAHIRQGDVEAIWIEGSNHDVPQNKPWKPVNADDPHFTLGFCYN